MPANLIGVWSLTCVGADASWAKALGTKILINKASVENKKKGLKKFVFIIRS
jgi:hypothetical protein